MINEWEKLENDPEGYEKRCMYCNMKFGGDKIQKAEWTFCPNCGARVVIVNAYWAKDKKDGE